MTKKNRTALALTVSAICMISYSIPFAIQCASIMTLDEYLKQSEKYILFLIAIVYILHTTIHYFVFDALGYLSYMMGRSKTFEQRVLQTDDIMHIPENTKHNKFDNFIKFVIYYPFLIAITSLLLWLFLNSLCEIK